MNPRVVLGVFQLLWINLFFIKPSNTLECYTCSSQLGVQGYEQNQNCEHFWNSNNYDQHRRSHCNHDRAVCAKYVVNHEGMVWVHRSCQPPDVCQFLHTRYGNPRSQLLECFTCDGNLCNAATRGRSPAVVGRLLGFALLLPLAKCWW